MRKVFFNEIIIFFFLMFGCDTFAMKKTMKKTSGIDCFWKDCFCGNQLDYVVKENSNSSFLKGEIQKLKQKLQKKDAIIVALYKQSSRKKKIADEKINKLQRYIDLLEDEWMKGTNMTFKEPPKIDLIKEVKKKSERIGWLL